MGRISVKSFSRQNIELGQQYFRWSGGGFGWKKKQLTENKFFYNFIVLRSKPQILSWIPTTRQKVYYRQKIGVFQKYTKL